MNIDRYGSLRDRGTTQIISGLSFVIGGEYRWLDNVRWDSESKQIVIEARYVLHTDGITHHNYRILLSLEDVTALVALLGHAGSASDAELLREHLGKNIPAIVKLLACATGLVPTPMPGTDPEARQKDKQGTRRRSKRTTA